MKLSVILAAVAAVAVSAQTTNIISLSAPVTAQKYETCKDLLMTWSGATVSSIPSITLLHGSSSALQPVQGISNPIAQNVDAKQGSSGTYTWTIPADLPTGSDYALSFGNSPDITYSSQFTITNTGAKCAGGSSGGSSGSSSGGSSPATSGATSSATTKPAAGSSSPSSKDPSNTAAPSSSATAPAQGNAAVKAGPAAFGVLAVAAVAAML